MLRGPRGVASGGTRPAPRRAFPGASRQALTRARNGIRPGGAGPARTLPSTSRPSRYPGAVKHRLRSAAAVAISVVSLSGVAGCAVFSPPTVLRPYQPSDGLSATVGDVSVRNALVVAPAADQPGVVSAALVNSGEQAAQVTVTVTSGSTPTTGTFTVGPGSTFTIGSGSGAPTETSGDAESATTGWLQLPTVTEVPGELIPMTFDAGGQSASLNAPIVRPCFAYAQLTPTPSASASATAGATPSSSAAASPSPTLNCQPEVGADETQGESGSGTES